MKRFRFGVCLALSCLLVSSSVSAQEPAPSSGDTARFQMSPFKDTLVLLNTESGETWMLVNDQESDEATWVEIPKPKSRRYLRLPMVELEIDRNSYDVNEAWVPAEFELRLRSVINPEETKKAFREWRSTEKELRGLLDATR